MNEDQTPCRQRGQDSAQISQPLKPTLSGSLLSGHLCSVHTSSDWELFTLSPGHLSIPIVDTSLFHRASIPNLPWDPAEGDKPAPVGRGGSSRRWDGNGAGEDSLGLGKPQLPALLVRERGVDPEEGASGRRRAGRLRDKWRWSPEHWAVGVKWEFIM